MSEIVYNFPPEMCCGWGEANRIGTHVQGLEGEKALLVTDEGVETAGVLAGVKASLKQMSLTFVVYNGVQPNPTDVNVEEGLKIYEENDCDIVVAVGGGSPMDAAKGIVLMVRHPGSLEEYYRGAKPMRPITADVPPFIAMPTTSGTGSEVSRGAIITDTAENRKRVIGSRHLLPKLAILDPKLTVSMPPKLTAFTGLDALTHSVEAFVVDRYAPIADAFAREGMRLVAESLSNAYKGGDNRRAREDMMMASTLGALAFQKGLGVVHSLAHQLSTQVDIPHGAACGIMLPHAVRFNISGGESLERVLAKYAELTKIFCVDIKGMTARGAAEKAVEVVNRLLLQLEVSPHLKDWGVTDEDITVMAKNAMLDHSHPRNPRACSMEVMTELFKKAL